MNDKKIISSEIFTLELDDYLTVRSGSITLSSFIRVIQLLSDFQSDFSKDFKKTYDKMKILMPNIKDQYTQLKGLMYFDQDIDNIHNKLKEMIDASKSKSKPVRVVTSNSMNKHLNMNPILVPAQAGGYLNIILSDLESFIVFVVKYILSDNDPLTMQSNDYFRKCLNMYLQDRELIKTLAQTDQSVCKYLCDSMLLKLISYKLNYVMFDKNVEYIKNILDNGMERVIKDFKVLTNKEYDNRKILDEIKKSSETISSHQELILAQKRLDKMHFEKRNKFDGFVSYYRLHKFKDDSNQNFVGGIGETKEEESVTIHTGTETKLQSHETTQVSDVVTENESDADTSQALDVKIENVSGYEKRDERRVFLINIGTQKYAIKFSTAKRPQYIKEACIYFKFKHIMEDEKEPNRNEIAKHILGLKHYGFLDNIKKNLEYVIFVEDNVGFSVSKDKNSELYDAIKDFAGKNWQDSVYYIVTENVVGEWNTLRQLSSTKTLNDNEVCEIVTNVIRIISYLNNKYNFVHWDLHDENIFVKITDHTSFKIYDFDHSELTYELPCTIDTKINDSLLDIMYDYHNYIITDATYKIKELEEPIMRRDIAMMYDIYRMYLTFLERRSPCNNVNLQILKNIITDICAKNSGYDNLFKTNFYGFIIVLADKANEYILTTKTNEQILLREWILGNYVFGEQMKKVGGFNNYYATKRKYLKLVSNNHSH